jgi:predicted small lipoprotein YifL
MRRGWLLAMRRGWPLACVLVCAMALAACGKKGPPDPPGPQNEITWPKTYPTH